MKQSFLKFLLAALFVISLTLPILGYVELKKRWQIDFEYKPLKTYKLVDATGGKNYYYFVYTLANNSDKPAPLGIDVCLKVDLNSPDLVAMGYPHKNKYYQDSLRPSVENEIIYGEENLLGFSVGIRKDRVKELKDKLCYLNCLEIRNKKEILPNEKIIGLAIFEGVDPQAKVFDVMVGGLMDVVKRRYDDETQSADAQNSHIEKSLEEARMNLRPTYEYENRIRDIIYLSGGGESKSLKEVVTAPPWIIRNYGPIGDKNGLGVMIKSLQDENPEIRWGSYFLLRRLTGLSYDYDTEKEPAAEENQKSIELWKEWWFRNKGKLVYNNSLNQFEIVEMK
jgi:hypothetical protein